MMKKHDPIIGKTYDAYNDGKASPSRLVRVTITDSATLQELGRHYVGVWRKALKKDFSRAAEGTTHYWGEDGCKFRMWDWNCNEFFFGEIPGDKESKKDPMLFAKTSWGGWYAVNWNYELDVSNKIRKDSIKNWKQCAKEMNCRMVWNKKSGKYDYFDLETGKKEDF